MTPSPYYAIAARCGAVLLIACLTTSVVAKDVYDGIAEWQEKNFGTAVKTFREVLGSDADAADKTLARQYLVLSLWSLHESQDSEDLRRELHDAIKRDPDFTLSVEDFPPVLNKLWEDERKLIRDEEKAEEIRKECEADIREESKKLPGQGMQFRVIEDIEQQLQSIQVLLQKCQKAPGMVDLFNNVSAELDRAKAAQKNVPEPELAKDDLVRWNTGLREFDECKALPRGTHLDFEFVIDTDGKLVGRPAFFRATPAALQDPNEKPCVGLISTRIERFRFKKRPQHVRVRLPLVAKFELPPSFSLVKAQPAIRIGSPSCPLDRTDFSDCNPKDPDARSSVIHLELDVDKAGVSVVRSLGDSDLFSKCKQSISFSCSRFISFLPATDRSGATQPSMAHLSLKLDNNAHIEEGEKGTSTNSQRPAPDSEAETESP